MYIYYPTFLSATKIQAAIVHKHKNYKLGKFPL